VFNRYRQHAVTVVAALLVMSPAGTAVEAQQASTLRVYIARHGQTDGNLNRIAQGWTDTPLNETGRTHAALLAERLQSVQLDGVYSSTLSRSRETAQTVAATKKGVTVVSLPELREVNLGRFENVKLDDPLLKTRPLGEERGPDDGERPSEVSARIKTAVDTIRARHQSGTVLVVGHAGIVGNLLRHLMSLTPQDVQGVNMANDELYMVELPQGFPPRIFKLIPQGNFKEL
jgi:probable phosphoglycerate mutase